MTPEHAPSLRLSPPVPPERPQGGQGGAASRDGQGPRPARAPRQAGTSRPRARRETPAEGPGLAGRVSITTRLRALADRPLTEFPSYVKIMQQVGLSDAEIAALTVGDCLAHMLIIQAIKGKNVRVTDIIDRIDGPASQ